MFAEERSFGSDADAPSVNAPAERDLLHQDADFETNETTRRSIVRERKGAEPISVTVFARRM